MKKIIFLFLVLLYNLNAKYKNSDRLCDLWEKRNRYSAYATRSFALVIKGIRFYKENSHLQRGSFRRCLTVFQDLSLVEHFVQQLKETEIEIEKIF